MRSYKKLENHCEALKNQLEEVQKKLDKALAVIDIRETLENLPVIADKNAKDKLCEAYAIMDSSITPIIAALDKLISWKGEYANALIGTKETTKKLFAAQKLIGEVIGKGGADDE